MLEYHKLVRDRIPEIIQSQGKQCEVRVLDAGEFRAALLQKLGEELDEYRDSGDVAELADLAEVLYALVAEHGVSRDDFEQIRLAKQEARGGFESRLLLVRAEQ